MHDLRPGTGLVPSKTAEGDVVGKELTESIKSKSRQKKIQVPVKDGYVMLTPNQKEYADLKMAEPKASLVSLAKQAYPNAAYNTLRQVVRQNEANTSIALYSNKQLADAKTTVYEIMQDKEVKPRDRLTAAFDIQDRTVGKAIQRTEVLSTVLDISIDLSGIAEAMDNDTPYVA